MNNPFVFLRKAHIKILCSLIIVICLFSFNSLILAADFNIKPRENILFSKTSEIQLAPGVNLSRHNEFSLKGLTQFSVLEISLTDPSIKVKPVISKGGMTSPSTVSKIVEENGLIAGTNGDFFDVGNSGAPLSTLIIDQEIVRSPRIDPDFSTLTILDSGRVFIEKLTSGGVVRGPDNINIRLNAYNDTTIPENGAVIFDSNWPLGVHKSSYSSWLKNEDTVVVLVDDNGCVLDVKKGPFSSEDLLVSSLPSILTANTQNETETTNEILIISKPKYEIISRGTAAKKAALLKKGDNVSISYGIMEFIPGIETAFAGKPVLVSKGQKCSDLKSYTSIQGNSVAPRTAVGINKSNDTMYIVVVDGRVTGSRGMTLDELADLMLSLGCYESLNLDGGGSSMLAYKDPITKEYEVSTRIAGNQRAVPYVIGVMYADEAEQNTFNLENLSLSLKAYIIEKNSDKSYSILEILGEYPNMQSNLIEGTDKLINDEPFIKKGRDILLIADLYDSNGNLIQLSNKNNLSIKWQLSGSASENTDIHFPLNNKNAAIISPSKHGGKLNISAQLVHERDNNSALYGTHAEFDVRVLGECAFIEIQKIEDHKIVEGKNIPFSINAYDEFGFLIPLDMVKTHIDILAGENKTSVNEFYIPYDCIKGPNESFLQISIDDILLTCKIKVTGTFIASELQKVPHIPESETFVENSLKFDETDKMPLGNPISIETLNAFEDDMLFDGLLEQVNLLENEINSTLSSVSNFNETDNKFFSPEIVDVIPLELICKSNGLNFGTLRLKSYNPNITDNSTSVLIDLSNREVQATNTVQWQSIADAIDKSIIQNTRLEIVVNGKPIINQDGKFESLYSTSADIELFLDILTFLSDGKDYSISVIQNCQSGDLSHVYLMQNGIQWIWQ